MWSQAPSILVANVTTALRQGDLSLANALVAQFRRQKGDTPEAIEALSWIDRGELAAGQLERALTGAEETRRLCQAALFFGSKPDENPHLAIALGASYEVEALVLERLNRRTEAVELLQNALKTWHGTSIVPRLRKNLNLLTIEGKPMPPLSETEWIGAKPPSMASLRGKVVLIFFWAHWCPDCKAEAPVLVQAGDTLESRGLVILGPTKRYGYTADDDKPSPEKEKSYIERVFKKYYEKIPNIRVPLDSVNFERYGASTTPTLVVADRRGIVRLYSPGVLGEADLRGVIEPLLNEPTG